MRTAGTAYFLASCFIFRFFNDPLIEFPAFPPVRPHKCVYIIDKVRSAQNSRFCYLRSEGVHTDDHIRQLPGMFWYFALSEVPKTSSSEGVDGRPHPSDLFFSVNELSTRPNGHQYQERWRENRYKHRDVTGDPDFATNPTPQEKLSMVKTVDFLEQLVRACPLQTIVLGSLSAASNGNRTIPDAGSVRHVFLLPVISEHSKDLGQSSRWYMATFISLQTPAFLTFNAR